MVLLSLYGYNKQRNKLHSWCNYCRAKREREARLKEKEKVKFNFTVSNIFPISKNI